MNHRTSCMAMTMLMLNCAVGQEPGRFATARLTVTTALKYLNTPLDPVIDFGQLVTETGLAGRFDPNSVVVWDLTADRRVPHALSEDFAYGDRGRIEFVISDPTHLQYEIRFATAITRPPVLPQPYVPAIGVGDLLRYNAGVPRPITMFYSMGLHDLNRDGVVDLAGTWNYAYRPGSPWSGVVVHAGIDTGRQLEFADLVRVRYESNGRKFFSHTYMSSAFADFNQDGNDDLVITRKGTGQAEVFVGTDQVDAGGMPIFRPQGSISVAGWQACRAVDLDRDGALDLVVDGTYIRNENPDGIPFVAAAPIQLDAGQRPCFLDVDADGHLDAVCLQGAENVQPDFYRVAWRRNLVETPPRFGPATIIADIEVPFCTAVAAYHDKTEAGLLVQHNAFQEISLYRLVAGEQHARFEQRGRAESVSAVISLSDQAWPSLCDWDDDGDQDLLVGGGYGWPRVLINQGTTARPSYSEPRLISSRDGPIRLLRNELLGGPPSWHNMGYPYPEFADWDHDGLKDLILPNETNRIYWYKNVGTSGNPRFDSRRQIECEGFPDSPELRQLSARRAADPRSNNGVYPYEAEQPFFWRTGVAIADFNADGLLDLVTNHGQHRTATLFAQVRRADGTLALKMVGGLQLQEQGAMTDAIVQRSAHWTESFRAVDWDGDGPVDLIYSIAGAHAGSLDGGSIYLLKNIGTTTAPRFAAPRAMKCFGEPIRITNHGPHPRPCDYDGDGQPDLIACVEWSVYPYYSHAALMMNRRPDFTLSLVAGTTSR